MNPIQRFLAEHGLHRPEYLGDGVYAACDGYQVWLLVERDGRVESIALDDQVRAALADYLGWVRDLQAHGAELKGAEGAKA
jgi:hypothetical protein